MTEIVYAPLRPEEAETLAALARRIWHAHYPGIIPVEQIEYMLKQRYQPGLIRQTLARGDCWQVARNAGALVGFAHGYALAEGDFKLDKLYIAPQWQRRGVGAALVSCIDRHARERGARRLVLRVNRHNVQAIAAYRKYGFEVLAPVVEAIGGGFVMDDYVMTKNLQRQ